MRFRIILLLAVTQISFSSLSACDACGCGIGGGGFGLLSVYRNNYVGIGYGHLPFKSRLTSGEYTGTEDAFHQVELSVRYEVLRGWRVDAFLPYRHHTRTGPAGDQSLSGIGDARLGLAYVLADNRPLGAQGGSWYLEVGPVVSLPTGAYDDDLLDSEFLPDNFNLGKGAVGYGLQSTMVLSSGTYGVAINARHQRYGKSTAYYRFGEETSAGARLFGQFAHDPHWKFIPFAGINYEYTAANRTVDDQPVHATGGRAWLASAGANVRYDDITISYSAGIPLSQNYSDGQAEAGLTTNLQLTLNF
ncbi:transporter [Neolewinella aurantiaca]|uniref:Transporter n=1 Tax=Neolewinella aurantiaca TaxID=2602767 RepID=A0A5C7FQL7_9BACT|nr:transporter [Neolewinella aurantiaca]TXF87666.1 transporter [Neolewinella aurantiaca]